MVSRRFLTNNGGNCDCRMFDDLPERRIESKPEITGSFGLIVLAVYFQIKMNILILKNKWFLKN